MIVCMDRKPFKFYPVRVSDSGSDIAVVVPDVGSAHCSTLGEAEETARELIAQKTGESRGESGVTVVRSMAVRAFAEEQIRGVKHAHVAPLNEFVEQLRLQKPDLNVPWVAPFYRGIDSRVLMLLRDPGPMADEAKGSGFLCAQNNDQSAENHSVMFARAGIDTREVLPWNSYPWYVNRAADGKRELADGVAALRAFLDLLPCLEVVMLAGVQARQVWNLLEKQHGDFLESRAISVVWTYHPSRQSLWHPDPAVRQWRSDHQVWTAVEIEQLLKGGAESCGRRYMRTVGPPPNLTPLGKLRPAKKVTGGESAVARGVVTKASDASSTRPAGMTALMSEVAARGGTCEDTLLGRRPEVRIAGSNDAVTTARVSVRSAGTWQSNAMYGDPHAGLDPNRAWIFVDLVPTSPEFYIAPEAWVQRSIAKVHREYLEKHGGSRPKSHVSNGHHAIALDRIEQWRDKWELLAL